MKLIRFLSLSVFLISLSGCFSENQDRLDNESYLVLPGALQSLSTCQGVQSLDQLEVRTAIGGGILDPRSLGLSEQKDGTIIAKADFELDGVAKEQWISHDGAGAEARGQQFPIPHRFHCGVVSPVGLWLDK